MAVFHPRARFDSYVENALPPVSRARISAHLAQCGECRDEVSQRERILEVSSSVQTSSPTRPPAPGPAFGDGRATGPDSAPRPVLEARDGMAGWKVVAGMGALGLTAAVVLSAAWIAGDPEAAAGTGTGGGDHLFPAAASPSVTSPSAASPNTQHGHDGLATAPDGAGGARGSAGAGEASAEDPRQSVDAVAPDGGGRTDPAVLTPAGVGSSAVSSSPRATAPPADASGHPGVALAGVALTSDTVDDLRQHGWNVPSLNGFGLHHDSTGWALVGDTAEVVMSLQGDGASLILHECRSLSEDGGVPGCPVGRGLTGSVPTAGEEGGKAAAGETRALPVGVEMSVLDRGDGTWRATTRTAQAAYTVESDLPVERAGRVMSLVVISERSRVQSGLAPERPVDRLARGFERLLPWMADPGPERR